MDNQHQQLLEQLRQMNEQLLAHLVNKRQERRKNKQVQESLKKRKEQILETIKQQINQGKL